MARIAVFDSGLGSLSVILAIRSVMKADIVYFADQQNFPYGLKSHSQLRSIITRTIRMLEERFSPDGIVMASNTPSLMLDIHNPKVIGVRPLRWPRPARPPGQVGLEFLQPGRR